MTTKEGGLRGSLRNVGVGVIDIPDSVVLQYSGSTFGTGDSVWSDDVDNSDMSIVGDPQQDTLPDGTKSVNFDGVDDRGNITPIPEVEGSSLQKFSIELSFASTDSGVNEIHNNRSPNGQQLQITTNKNEGFNDDPGNIFIRFNDTADDGIRFSFQDGGVNLFDGSRKDLSIIFDDATQSNVRLILNGAEKTISFDRQENPSSFESWGNDIGAFYSSQFDNNELNINVGYYRWHNDAIAEQTINDL